jgi:hypothetical protein
MERFWKFSIARSEEKRKYKKISYFYIFGFQSVAKNTGGCIKDLYFISG